MSGYYLQTVFCSLIATLILVLVILYFISISAVPLFSLFFLNIKNPLLLKVEKGFNYVISRINDASKTFLPQYRGTPRGEMSPHWSLKPTNAYKSRSSFLLGTTLSGQESLKICKKRPNDS